jgi:hypothetical protein
MDWIKLEDRLPEQYDTVLYARTLMVYLGFGKAKKKINTR